jgi:hypothetical protein
MKISVDYIPPSEIVPYKNNPRKNDVAAEKVAESIAEFGFKNPIILDKNNEIIAGHTRLKAVPIAKTIIQKKIKAEQDKNNLDKVAELQLKLDELEEVPVLWADDLTEDQVKAFRIADNKTTEYAEWDFELLKQEFYDLEDTESFNSTGFSSEEVTKIWESFNDEGDDDFTTKRGTEELELNSRTIFLTQQEALVFDEFVKGVGRSGEKVMEAINRCKL